MNPDKNEWGVWKTAYKHVVTVPGGHVFINPIEERLKTGDFTEANAELARIMKLK
jgi:surfactin synthase thioesterase subunit